MVFTIERVFADLETDIDCGDVCPGHTDRRAEMRYFRPFSLPTPEIFRIRRHGCPCVGEGVFRPFFDFFQIVVQSTQSARRCLLLTSFFFPRHQECRCSCVRQTGRHRQRRRVSVETGIFFASLLIPRFLMHSCQFAVLRPILAFRLAANFFHLAFGPSAPRLTRVRIPALCQRKFHPFPEISVGVASDSFCKCAATISARDAGFSAMPSADELGGITVELAYCSNCANECGTTSASYCLPRPPLYETNSPPVSSIVRTRPRQPLIAVSNADARAAAGMPV